MNVPIPIRRPVLSLSDPERDRSGGGIPRHWHAAGPFATHFYDALSSTFPFGEAFFVRSVAAYRERVGDPDLLERVRGFAGQEGQHSRLHDEHLVLLRAQGYGLIDLRNRIGDRMLRFYSRRTPRFALAATAALEHLTAILARRLLADSARQTVRMHGAMAPLWRWHALEESEHKAVAYDVLMQVAPNHALRAFAMVIGTIFLVLETMVRTTYMLGKDGLLFDGPTWQQGFRFLFGEEGLLIGTGTAYRAWFRVDFHPDQLDDSALIAEIRPRVDREIGALERRGDGVGREDRACSST